MSNYSSLKATINANIKTNGNQEITGSVLNSVLNAMVNTLGAGYQYAGVATPSSNPGTPDTNVFYIAATAGTYTNMGGLVLVDGEVAFLKYNGTWKKDVTGIAESGKLAEMQQQVVNIIGQSAEISNFGIVQNEYVNSSNGAFVSYNGWSRTDYIEIGDYSSIEIRGSVSPYCWMYDGNKNPVRYINLSLQTIYDLASIPNAKYIVVSDTTANIVNLAIKVNGYSGNNLTNLNNRVAAIESYDIAQIAQRVADMWDSMLVGYKFGGVVSPSDSPIESEREKFFYIAEENGIYQNFGGTQVYDSVVILFKSSNSPNLLNLDTLIPNKYIDSNGQLANYPGWTASQRMKIVVGTTYKVVSMVNGVWTRMNSIWFALYDANGNMTHRNVTTDGIQIDTRTGDDTLAVSWGTMGETPMVVPFDYDPVSYVEPGTWQVVVLSESEKPEIVLPAKLAFLQDKQFDMMINNILYRGSAKNVGFKNLGSSTMYAYPYEDRIRINQPNEVTNGISTIRIQQHSDCAFDKTPQEQRNVLSKSFSYRSILKTQGGGLSRRVMFIGDSITANGVYPREVANLFSNDDMSVQLIGTLGQSPAYHEGRGGWSAEDYCTKDSYNTYTNAFLNPNTNHFDFSYYMSNNNFDGVDYVFITLGINDVYKQTKPLTEEKYNTIISYYNEMITSIRAYNAGIKIFIGLPILPANSDWTLSYDADITKAERLGLIQRLIQEYDNRENEGFVIVPLYCVVDTERDFPTEDRPICARDETLLVPFVTDPTHPKVVGYYKIADVMFTYIKYGTTL